jgi:hypothetical protein
MVSKKPLSYITLLLLVTLCHKNFSMDFLASKAQEAIIFYKLAGDRLSDSESAKIFFGVAGTTLVFDFLLNLGISKIDPELYSINKKDAWDQKLYKPFKESISSSGITSISLGVIALFRGYLFRPSPLKFSDMVKPGAFLLSGIGLASFATGFLHYYQDKHQRKIDNTLSDHKSISMLTRTSASISLTTLSFLLPFIFKYC